MKKKLDPECASDGLIFYTCTKLHVSKNVPHRDILQEVADAVHNFEEKNLLTAITKVIDIADIEVFELAIDTLNSYGWKTARSYKKILERELKRCE